MKRGHGKVGGCPVSSLAAVYVAESQMSAMTTTFSGMSKNIAWLLNISEKHQRKIEKIRVKQREENLFSSSSSSSSEDEIRSNQCNQALARGSPSPINRRREPAILTTPQVVRMFAP